MKTLLLQSLSGSIKLISLAGLLVALTACSGAQKISGVPKTQKQAYQRVPLSEDVKKLVKFQVRHAMIAIQKTLDAGVVKIADPEYTVNIVKENNYAWTPQSYQLPENILWSSMGLGAAAGTYGFTTIGGTAMFAAAPVATVVLGAGLGLLGGIFGGLLVATGVEVLVDPEASQQAIWPHRFKVVYQAVNKKTKQKFEGHCSAYFFNNPLYKPEQGTQKKTTQHTKPHGRYYTRQRKHEKAKNLVKPHTTGKLLTGFSAPFEIDGCTHENIFPETHPGQLRIGHGVDPTDRLLGQHLVAAHGQMDIRFTDNGNVKFTPTMSVRSGVTVELMFVSHQKPSIKTEL